MTKTMHLILFNNISPQWRAEGVGANGALAPGIQAVLAFLFACGIPSHGLPYPAMSLTTTMSSAS